MTDKGYSIVTLGEIQEGLSRKDVGINLHNLCKYKLETIQSIFSGKPFVFKSGLDLQTAKKYKVALDKTGIICRIAQPKTSTIKANISPPKPKPKVTCPKCGTEQEDGLCCVACLVVMSKYNQSPPEQMPSHYAASAQTSAANDVSGGFPLLKVVVSILIVVSLGVGALVANPFASDKGKLSKELGRYENHHYGFALSFPSAWNAYTVEEAIECATIRSEYADAYLMLLSPTNPDHSLMVVNISGVTLSSFNQKGWDGMVKSTNQRHPVSFESVDQINGLKVYRVGYDIASSYREDAYFEANGTLIQIYFFVKKGMDTEYLVAEMRSLLNDRLSAI